MPVTFTVNPLRRQPFGLPPPPPVLWLLLPRKAVDEHAVARLIVHDPAEPKKALLDALKFRPERIGGEEGGPEPLCKVALLNVVPTLEGIPEVRKALVADALNVLLDDRKLPPVAHRNELPVEYPVHSTRWDHLDVLCPSPEGPDGGREGDRRLLGCAERLVVVHAEPAQHRRHVPCGALHEPSDFGIVEHGDRQCIEHGRFIALQLPIRTDAPDPLPIERKHPRPHPAAEPHPVLHRDSHEVAQTKDLELLPESSVCVVGVLDEDRDGLHGDVPCQVVRKGMIVAPNVGEVREACVWWHPRDRLPALGVDVDVLDLDAASGAVAHLRNRLGDPAEVLGAVSYHHVRLGNHGRRCL